MQASKNQVRFRSLSQQHTIKQSTFHHFTIVCLTLMSGLWGVGDLDDVFSSTFASSLDHDAHSELVNDTRSQLRRLKNNTKSFKILDLRYAQLTKKQLSGA